MRIEDYKRPNKLTRFLNWTADTFPFLYKISFTKPIGFVFIIIAWATGQIEGWLAWGLLLVSLDFGFDIKRN